MSRRHRPQRHREPPPPPSAAPAAFEWRLHPAAAQVVAFAAIAVVGVFFYAKMPMEHLRQLWSHWRAVLPPLSRADASVWLNAAGAGAWLALLHASACGLGQAVLRGLALDPEDRLERLLLGSALGWGAFGLAMLGLGLAGLWRTWALAVLLGSGLAGFAFSLLVPRMPGGSSQPAPKEPEQERWKGWEGFLALILAVLAGFDFYGALMPEIFYDALVYHLALPDVYWAKGGIVPMPELLYSGLPLMVQMLYGIALPLGGELLCRVLHWSFGCEAAVLTYALGRRLAGRNAGILAAALFYGIPLVSAMSWKAAVEHGQAVFQTAALLALARCLSAQERTWAVAAGVLTGFAMGSKYQAWPLLPVLALGLLWTWRERPSEGWVRPERRMDLALFAGAAVLMAAPWCVKNALHYGNPLFPLFHERFADVAVPRWRELMQDAEAVRPAEVFGSWKALAFWLTHPWRVCFENMDHGSLLFMSVPVVLLGRLRAGAPRFFWLSWLGLWLSWSLTTRMVRYALPSLPLACVLTAMALDAGFDRKLRVVLRAGLAYAFVFQVVYVMTWFKVLGATEVVLGRADAAGYLAVPHASYHCPVQPAIDFVNANTPPDAKVLFLGEARRFRCRRDAVVMSYYDEYPLQWWISRSAGPEDIHRTLREAGITHILVNRLELARWQSPGRKYLRLTEGRKDDWSRFMSRHARRVFQKRIPESGPIMADTAVYELVASTAARP
ncbi:MAG: glycosyltransferase family 39 protein [Elusimicrobia bacterium]|nr:glycosyltransferase family 39 protein [Elusimicrobiota bacterium]